MATKNMIQYLSATIAFLLAWMLVLASNSPSPPPPPVGCSDEVVAFSPCLPFISAPPNNQTDSPSSECCDVYTSAFNGGNANCLCYFIRQPLLFGFPLNNSKILSLSSLCPGNISLESLCLASQTLPPLQSITGPGLTIPNNSGSPTQTPPQSTSGPNISQPPFINSPPESAGESSTQAPPSVMPVGSSSSASKQINKNSNWSQPRIMILLVPIISCL